MPRSRLLRAQEDVDLLEVAAGLERYLARDFVSLDEALGLNGQVGREPWWAAERRRTRDEALRCLAERFYADQPIATQASAIALLSRRYEVTAWRFDAEADAMPTRYVGTPKAYLFAAFRAQPGALSDRHLRRILAGDRSGHQTPRFHGQDREAG